MTLLISICWKYSVQCSGVFYRYTWQKVEQKTQEIKVMCAWSINLGGELKKNSFYIKFYLVKMQLFSNISIRPSNKNFLQRYMVLFLNSQDFFNTSPLPHQCKTMIQTQFLFVLGICDNVYEWNLWMDSLFWSRTAFFPSLLSFKKLRQTWNLKVRVVVVFMKMDFHILYIFSWFFKTFFASHLRLYHLRKYLIHAQAQTKAQACKVVHYFWWWCRSVRPYVHTYKTHR